LLLRLLILIVVVEDTTVGMATLVSVVEHTMNGTEEESP
jgi:hypothetical protein